MNTHKKLTKVYGENVCTACGKSWDDRDEVPVCDPIHDPITKEQARIADKVIAQCNSITVKAWLHIGRHPVAMLCYARTKEEAESVFRRFTPFACVMAEPLPDNMTRWVVIERIPYIEINPRTIEKLNEESPFFDLPIMSPQNFRKADQ